MKKNTVKNQKLLSAITVGISAMMFLQTPVSAYAAEYDNLDLDTGDGDSHQEENHEEISYEPATTEAQAEAQEAFDACVTTEAPAPAAETPAEHGQQEEPFVGSAQVETQEAADIILTGDEANNIPPAGDDIATEEVVEAVTELKEAATEVKEDTSIVDAAKEITEVRTDLAQAEVANLEAAKEDKKSMDAAEAAADMLEGDQGIFKVADSVDEIVKESEEAGKELVQKIADAQTPEERQQAQADLDKLIKDNTETMTGQITLYSSLSKQYEEAKAELEKAQENLEKQENTFNDEIAEAKGNAAEAKSEVVAAQEKVDHLATAMQKVQNAISDTGNENADKLDASRENWSNVFGKSIDASRNVMIDVITNYYLPEVLGINVVEDDEHKTEASVHNKFSDYERNYTQVNFWYIDDNNELKQGTKYFNWDNIAKTDRGNQNHTSNSANNREASTAIVMYEKTEDEVNPEIAKAEQESIAIGILNSLSDEEKSDYQRNAKFILDDSNIDRCRQQGALRLYSYVDETGNTQYITQFQLLGGYPKGKGTYNDEGDLTKTSKCTVVENPDGSKTFTIGGISFNGLKMEETIVDQNKNGLYKNANCLIIGDNDIVAKVLRGEGNYNYVKENIIDRYSISDDTVNQLIADNARLNNFISANNTANKQALADKYDVYAAEVVEAQLAVENASRQVDELSEAIDNIREESVRKSKTMKATEALGTSNIAAYFGLTDLSDEEAGVLNDMTLVEVINQLYKYKKEADEKVEKAKLAFVQVVDNILADAERESQNPIPGSQTPSGGGDETPAAETETIADNAVPTAGTIAETLPPAAGAAVDATETATSAANATAAILAAAEAAMNIDTAQAVPAAQAIYTNQTATADGMTAAGDIQGGNGTVNIADGDVALAGGVEENAGIELPDAPIEEATVETLAPQTNIEDPEVALAKSATKTDEAKKMNWWWVLIVALLGVTGKKMYEEHMRKEEEKNKKLD